MTFNVVHVLANASFEAGGPSRSVARLCRELAQDPSTRVALVTGLVGTQEPPGTIAHDVDAHVAHYNTHLTSLIATKQTKMLAEVLKQQPAAVVHLHSLWHPALSRALRLAKRLSTTTILSPRGTLEPWAMNWHRRRKMIALHLYQQADLAAVDGFVATSDSEAEHIRALGLNQPVAVIPNGIDIQPQKTEAAGLLKAQNPRRRILLSLGRIHPQKGLKNLVIAWSLVRPADWELHIAGTDEVGHQSELVELVSELRLDSQVVFRGPVLDEAKASIYEEASAFVIASHSENFANVVTEALSFGLPVIATWGTPWRNLETRASGWWVASTPEALATAIRELVQAKDADRALMSSAARNLASEYAWGPIAAELMAFYEHVRR